jgi:hypothetical protein
MSAIVVSGDTSGAVTLSAPTVAGTVTVTLPAASGTMLTTASTTGVSGNAISSGTVAEAYGGTGTTTGYYGFKNRFINGSMLVAQYGTTATISTSNGLYTLDRWQSRNPATTGGTATYAQIFDSTTGVTKLRLTYASATASAYFQQKIEAQNITDLWGNQVTFSIYSNDAAVNISAYSYDSSGTEATLFSNAALTSLGSNRYSYTFTCTTPVGGIRGGNALGMIIQINVRGGATPANSTNYDYWNCQLEKGATATSFDYRDYGRELIMCQRYFCVSAGGTQVAQNSSYTETMFQSGCGTAFSDSDGRCNIYTLPVVMRTSPTVTIIGNTLGASSQYSLYSRNGGWSAASSTSPNGRPQSIEVNVVKTSGFVGIDSFIYIGGFIASAEL